MAEVTDHIAYDLLKGKYSRVGLDYVILRTNEKANEPVTDCGSGVPEIHKEAVITAFQVLNQRFAEYEYQVDIRPDKMLAEKSSIEELLELPPEEIKNKQRGKGSTKGERNYSVSHPIPYWYAFLEPPHGIPYDETDFIEFNKVLFPNQEDMEVYRWNDDFSDYFDDGKEWWGTGLWTVYDKKEQLITVIGASLTD